MTFLQLKVAKIESNSEKEDNSRDDESSAEYIDVVDLLWLLAQCISLSNRLTVDYPVKDFSGRKKMILSTVSLIGGKNPFLGIAYMVVGVLCILLAVVFVIIHFKCGKK